MRFLTLLSSLLLCGMLAAQVPQAFDFQAVARDASGNVLSGQAVSVRLTVHSASPGGAIAYQETHAVTTNAFGLFSVAVGQGSTVQGVFAEVSWSAAAHYLQVELDATGGSNYVHMGTTQLLSVPYALHAGGVDCPTVSLLGDTLKQANGCFVIIPGLSAANGGCADADNDGFYNNAGCPPLDCDDTDPNVNPGGTEVCGNGEDEDCDGTPDNVTDPGAFVTFFVDTDGDGFGDASISNVACAQPAGYVTNDDDCDDSDASVFPGQNCSIACTAAEVAWMNANFGQYRQALMSAFTSCVFESDPGTCIQNQLLGYGFPLSAECNACGITWANCVRTNCLIACVQGQAACESCMNTAGCNAGLMQCFGLTDADGDGWPAGSDCDDANAAFYPGAPELCDGLDNDCNGQIDNNPVNGTAYYFDQDGDGYGTNAAGPFLLCTPEPGMVDNFNDCNDFDPLIYLDAPELCDGIDNNCNGAVDENCPGCVDNDTDGFTTCQGDCDDTNALVNPAEQEVCGDGLDNDCDGQADEDCGSCFDNDGDGFTTCQGDCNDNNVGVNPIAVEVCDGLDNDCDGQTDEGCGPQEICDGLDNDGDGQVDEGFNLGQACGCGGVWVCDGIGGSTCSVPMFPDVCGDGIDNNCDGQVDENCAGTECGFFNGTFQGTCDSGSLCVNGYCVPCADNDADSFTICTGDCDDTNANVNPGATELCGDGLDNDCDGQADEDCGSCLDNDGDGFTTCQGDCNDNNVAVNPNAAEVCDGLDDDCDGQTDEGCGPQEICDGIDNDGDGQVDEGLNLGAACGCGGVLVCDGNGGTTCSVPIGTEICADGIDNDCDGLVDENCGGCTDNDVDGFTTCAGDCDDTNANVNPGATELCDDGLDNDCDGQADEDCGSCLDNDGDGFTTCQGDCNDNNVAVNPNAVEVCDGLDNDCDGQVNEGAVCGCAPAGTPCEDGNACTVNDTEDGACNCISGFNAPAGTACDDGNPNTINDVCDGTGSCSGTPIQNEVCNGIDDDGDGLLDAADPSLVLVPCENQVGVCNGAQKTANLCVGGAWLTCSLSEYAAGSPVFEPTETTCDSQDNDCDGLVDEDNVCNPCSGPNMCSINGECFTSGQANPAAYCQVCDPLQSTTSWSFRPFGTVCLQGNACTNDSFCNGAGQCGSITFKPAGTPCDDGNPNTSNDVCNGSGVCVGTP